MHARKGVAEGAAVGAAAVAVAVTYGIYAVHPWQGSTPLNQFLAAFAAPTRRPGRCRSCGIWPPRPWSAGAVAGRRSSQLICALAAAYFAWIGIGYFAWLSPGIGLSGVWPRCSRCSGAAGGRGIARRDLVIRPRLDLSSGWALSSSAMRCRYPLVGGSAGTRCAWCRYSASRRARQLPSSSACCCGRPAGAEVPAAHAAGLALNAAPHNMATGSPRTTACSPQHWSPQDRSSGGTAPRRPGTP